MALKKSHGGAAWNRWEKEVAWRQPAALNSAARSLADEILFQKYLQYQFFGQWQSLRDYAHRRGIRLIGDVPIYVAHDSADVWSHPELFCLDEKGNPTLVAGVPPDYFSATGQRWGNPIYRWDAMARSGYVWWLQRFRAALATVDLVVLDHFRGFEAYWEVPAGATTAVEGRWVTGPGATFLEALQKGLELKELPFIAEDLGVITPAVEALRDRFGFPGMKVLQFAFDGDARNPHLPHNYPRDCVVYTGTHNNDTTVGWFSGIAGSEQRGRVFQYLGRDADDGQIHWHLVRLAMASVADLAIFPLQDLLGLDSESRMNWPGTAQGNWRWRCLPGMLSEELKERLRQLTIAGERGGASKSPEVERLPG
jgi:4-alpha-glucanotransferase